MNAAIAMKDRCAGSWSDAELHIFPAEGDRETLAVVVNGAGHIVAPDNIALISLQHHDTEDAIAFLIPALECGYCVCHTDTTR